MNKFIRIHFVTFIQLAFPSVMVMLKSGPSCLLYKNNIIMYYLNSCMNYILTHIKFSTW